MLVILSCTFVLFNFFIFIYSGFNGNKLALTDLKIYQCLYFVSKCTPVMFFPRHVYKNDLNVLIELWPNPGLV